MANSTVATLYRFQLFGGYYSLTLSLEPNPGFSCCHRLGFTASALLPLGHMERRDKPSLSVVSARDKGRGFIILHLLPTNHSRIQVRRILNFTSWESEGNKSFLDKSQLASKG